MQKDDVARIAAGLTARDKILLIATRNGVASRPKFSIQAMERLIDLGFAYETNRSSHGAIRVRLEPLGKAVRNYLTENRDDQ